MAEYARAYLSSGGPTSRLEEALSALGQKLGFPSEIYATPTGVFVSCMDASGKTNTSVSRIRESGMNLARLCWLEEIFEDVFSQKLSISGARRILVSKHTSTPPYSFVQTIGSAFLAGFASSLSTYGKLGSAILCAFVTTATWWVAGPGLRRRVQSSIFRDFVGCATTLVLAGICQRFFPGPFEAYTMGGIMVLVPGLALTSAIAELADQNLVSGTAKLMQAILTLLALGLAYILFYDLSNSLGIETTVVSTKHAHVPQLGSILGILVSITCFGVMFRVPRRSLPFSTLTGFIGWWILHQFDGSEYVVAAPYLAALAVGMIGLYLGNRFRVPSQVFSVPGIIAMLPGMLALKSFNSFAMGHGSSGIDLGFRVALTAGGIVFGLFTARIPFAFRVRKVEKPI